jgi:hypothetical protein
MLADLIPPGSVPDSRGSGLLNIYEMIQSFIKLDPEPKLLEKSDPDPKQTLWVHNTSI